MFLSTGCSLLRAEGFSCTHTGLDCVKTRQRISQAWAPLMLVSKIAGVRMRRFSAAQSHTAEHISSDLRQEFKFS
jgi:hypothetical protein